MPLTARHISTMPTALTNEALLDEQTSINSIYDPETLTPLSEAATLFALRLPSLPSIVLRVEFPANYPDAPPSVLGTQSVGEDVAKGVGTNVVHIVRDVLARSYVIGQPCIFDLVEEVRDEVEKVTHLGMHNDEREQDTGHGSQDPSAQIALTQHEMHDPGPEPPWIVAPPMTEKKSIFLARCAHVSSPAQARSYVTHLLATDKKAARATHNITAWRIQGVGESSYQDCDDDGETAAGGRILHLMQLMDVWDVMVVVTRWYGGVLLGPDRFKIINEAAREALVLGGYVGGKGGPEAKEGKRKSKK